MAQERLIIEDYNEFCTKMLELEVKGVINKWRKVDNPRERDSLLHTLAIRISTNYTDEIWLKENHHRHLNNEKMLL